MKIVIVFVTVCELRGQAAVRLLPPCRLRRLGGFLVTGSGMRLFNAAVCGKGGIREQARRKYGLQFG